MTTEIPLAAPAPAPAPEPARAGGCGCGRGETGVPELDVRTIPHAIRHAAVLGAFGAIAPGASLDLVAPHRPAPLLREIIAAAGGSVEVNELERTREHWRGRLTRG